MPGDHRLVSAPNLVVGVSIMFLGIALTVDRLDLADARTLLRWWPLLLILFGASLVVQAWRIHDEAVSAPASAQSIVSPGFVLFAVIVFLLVTHVQRRHETSAWDAGADEISMFVVMSNEEHTSRAARFRGGDLTSLMARARLDLREANIAPGEEAVIDVLTVMGRLELLVPEGWTVDIEAPRVMGRVRDERSQRVARQDPTAQAPPEAPEPVEAPSGVTRPPRLVVRGLVMMGGVTIRS